MFYLNYQNSSAFEKNLQAELETLGKPTQSFIFASISEFDNSPKRAYMLKAQDYYNNDNEVLKKKRYYIDRHGIRREAKNVANAQLPHPFLRKLTKQKVNYLLSRQLSITSEDDLFLENVNNYFNKQFFKMLKNTGTQAIVNGIAWIQVFYNDKGELSFKRIPTEELIPIWEDSEHTKLSAMIRYYEVDNYLADGSKKVITKIEYHTTQGVWYYIKGDKGLVEDLTYGGTVQGHFKVRTPITDDHGIVELDEDGNEVFEITNSVWERVPFIAFKYNAEEMSLLKLVKALIDDYDTNTSDVSNLIQDTPNSVTIVKNYDGTDKTEFMENLNTFRVAFLRGDGDIKNLTNSIDTATAENHMTRTRKDIYEAGNGVDTQEESLGNASGQALKFRYADLSMDSTDMANEFETGLENLIWFIKVDMLNRGLGDFMETDYDIIFNTDTIINESEVITDAKNSVGLISDETIIANHPWVTDAEEETKRMEKQRKEMMEQLMPQEGDDDYGTKVPSKQAPKKDKETVGD